MNTIRTLSITVAMTALLGAGADAHADGIAKATKYRTESIETRTPEQRAAARDRAAQEWERRTSGDRAAARARAKQLRARWEGMTEAEREAAGKAQAKQRPRRGVSKTGAADGLH